MGCAACKGAHGAYEVGEVRKEIDKERRSSKQDGSTHSGQPASERAISSRSSPGSTSGALTARGPTEGALEYWGEEDVERSIAPLIQGDAKLVQRMRAYRDLSRAVAHERLAEIMVEMGIVRVLCENLKRKLADGERPRILSLLATLMKREDARGRGEMDLDFRSLVTSEVDRNIDEETASYAIAVSMTDGEGADEMRRRACGEILTDVINDVRNPFKQNEYKLKPLWLLGNLAKCRDCHKAMGAAGAVEALCALLDHPHDGLKLAAADALVPLLRLRSLRGRALRARAVAKTQTLLCSHDLGVAAAGCHMAAALARDSATHEPLAPLLPLLFAAGRHPDPAARRAAAKALCLVAESEQYRTAILLGDGQNYVIQPWRRVSRAEESVASVARRLVGALDSAAADAEPEGLAPPPAERPRHRSLCGHVRGSPEDALVDGVHPALLGEDWSSDASPGAARRPRSKSLFGVARGGPGGAAGGAGGIHPALLSESLAIGEGAALPPRLARLSSEPPAPAAPRSRLASLGSAATDPASGGAPVAGRRPSRRRLGPSEESLSSGSTVEPQPRDGKGRPPLSIEIPEAGPEPPAAAAPAAAPGAAAGSCPRTAPRRDITRQRRPPSRATAAAAAAAAAEAAAAAAAARPRRRGQRPGAPGGGGGGGGGGAARRPSLSSNPPDLWSLAPQGSLPAPSPLHVHPADPSAEALAPFAAPHASAFRPFGGLPAGPAPAPPRPRPGPAGTGSTPLSRRTSLSVDPPSPGGPLQHAFSAPPPPPAAAAALATGAYVPPDPLAGYPYASPAPASPYAHRPVSSQPRRASMPAALPAAPPFPAYVAAPLPYSPGGLRPGPAAFAPVPPPLPPLPNAFQGAPPAAGPAYGYSPSGYPSSPSGYPSSPGSPGSPQGYPSSPYGYPVSPQGYPGSPYGYPVSPQGYPGSPHGYPGSPQGYGGLPPPPASPLPLLFGPRGEAGGPPGLPGLPSSRRASMPAAAPSPDLSSRRQSAPHFGAGPPPQFGVWPSAAAAAHAQSQGVWAAAGGPAGFGGVGAPNGFGAAFAPGGAPPPLLPPMGAPFR
eukprot:tig00021012_g17006.t1